MAGIAARKEIAKEQAEILGTALGKSNIDIVSGDPGFFNSFAQSLSMGKTVSGFLEKSPEARSVLDAVLGRVNRAKGGVVKEVISAIRPSTGESE